MRYCIATGRAKVGDMGGIVNTNLDHQEFLIHSDFIYDKQYDTTGSQEPCILTVEFMCPETVVQYILGTWPR